MTKVDLIRNLSDRLGLSPVAAEQAVDAMLDAIINALKAGERANISGFGTFTVSERAARSGRNPKTGEPAEISASRSVKFSPASRRRIRSTGSHERRPFLR